MIKSALKALRRFGPFNRASTTAVRWLLKTMDLSASWIGTHLHRYGEVRSPLPNGRVFVSWSMADDQVSNRVFWHGWAGFEPETSPLFFHLCRSLEDGVVLDVGAHVGYYTILAAHASPHSRVFAFEPHPLTFERLKSNVARNGLSNVECVAAAVGAAEGHADYFYPPEGIPATASVSHSFMAGLVAGDLGQATVPMIALDSFLAQRRVGPVRVVKMDIDTGEPGALSGMVRILSEESPTVFCEVLAGHECERQLELILSPLRYLYYQLTEDGPSLRPHITPDRVWRNYLFTKAPLEDVRRWWAAAAGASTAPAGAVRRRKRHVPLPV